MSNISKTYELVAFVMKLNGRMSREHETIMMNNRNTGTLGWIATVALTSAPNTQQNIV